MIIFKHNKKSMAEQHLTENAASPTQLKRTLGPLMLWGLGVGYVISGMYFGWNLGLPEGGTLGLAIATFFIIILYITFTFSYTELACAIPKAGGVFDYATRAMGKDIGFIAGMAHWCLLPYFLSAVFCYHHRHYGVYSFHRIEYVWRKSSGYF
jgi:amino acid transporter